VEDPCALLQIDVDGGQEVVLARLAGDNVGEDHAGALAGHHSLGGEAHHDLARRGRAVDQLLEGARPSSNTTTIMTKTYDLVRFNLHVTVHLVNTGVYVSSNLPVGKDTTAPYQIRPRVFHNEALPTARITFIVICSLNITTEKYHFSDYFL
jgi:hypothetical protein